MLLQLRNIGMIEEADIKLDGLTVIAGENDTGKSTVGKALFALLKARLFVLNSKLEYNAFNSQYFKKLIWLFDKISKKELLHSNTSIKLDDIAVDFLQKSARRGDKKFLDAIFIETPFIFNLYETLSAISNANSILDFEIPYNYLWWDLYLKLSHKAKTPSSIDFSSQIEFIENIVGGKFEKFNEPTKNRWFFVREKRAYEMVNVAMGIKQFAILYSIIKNGYMSSDRVIIFDEPEVHLHPKWQLKFAELIVQLVEKGVKILVNSHSPYMIEALELFTKKYKIPVDFYVAKRENEYAFFKNINSELSPIYEELAQPIDILEEMALENFQWTKDAKEHVMHGEKNL